MFKIKLAYYSMFFCSLLSAQELPTIKFHLSTTEQLFEQENTIELVFTVELLDDWHLYSNKQSYDLGPRPTTFQFEPHSSYQLVGEVEPFGAKKEFDEIFEVDINYFEHTAEFRQKVKILTGQPVIKGVYTYQLCSPDDGRCVPGNCDFEFGMVSESTTKMFSLEN